MVIVSEFGYPGFYAKDLVQADPIRIRTLQQQMPILAARDWIAGAIQWCYQDYKSPRNLWPGQAEGYVEHGVVDENRQRKPSYDVWKQLNAPAKLDVQWTGAVASGFSATIVAKSARDPPYRPLSDYELSWILRDEQGNLVANGQQHFDQLIGVASVQRDLPTARPFQRLAVTLRAPSGAVAAERTIEWSAQPASFLIWPNGA